MFGFQPQDLLIIAVVALLLFGPGQLPRIARALGKTLAEFRAATDEVKTPVDDAAQIVRASLSEQPLLVFVSSIMNPNCDDLRAERAAAKKAIEALPLSRSWRFEDSPASPETAPRVYLRKVKECDIVVWVLGKEITYPVLREYATARQHKRPRLAFLKKCERAPATQQFVRHISGEVKWKDFGATIDLEWQIQIAIVDLLLLKFRDKLTANEVVVLTALLSQLNKLIETPPQPAEPKASVPQIEFIEPEPPRVEKTDSLFAPTYRRGKDGKRMILIPASKFLRGTSDADILEMTLRFGWDSQWFDNEKPQRTIYLDAFYIDEMPVTNAEYQRFLDANHLHNVPYDWDKTWRTFPTGKDNHPVVKVIWGDANAYARWASGWLPTEAEWEKAARGTDGRRYPWGNEQPDASRCNFDSNEQGATPVGKYSPRGDSPFGVKDMAGNVWEWCADWYDIDYYKISTRDNPRNDTPGLHRVVRGGAFVNGSQSVGCAYRIRYCPDGRNWGQGFRVVCAPV